MGIVAIWIYWSFVFCVSFGGAVWYITCVGVEIEERGPLIKYITLNGRCKLCNMLRQDRQLFDETHRRLLILNQSQAVVAKWLNGRVEIKNLSRDKDDQIKTFSPQNFTRHLKKHINDRGRFVREIAIPPPPITHSTFTEVEQATADAAVTPEPNELDEFLELEDTVKVLLLSLKSHKEGLKKSLDSGNKPSRVDVETTYKMLGSVLESKQFIAKVRNSSQVAGAAVRRTIELLTTIFLDKLIEATNEQQSILSQQMEGSLPAELNTMLRNRLGAAMKSAIFEVADEVTAEFRIKSITHD